MVLQIELSSEDLLVRRRLVTVIDGRGVGRERRM